MLSALLPIAAKVGDSSTGHWRAGKMEVLKSSGVFLSFFSSSVKVPLIYNVVLVSGVQQSDSVTHYICILF